MLNLYHHILPTSPVCKCVFFRAATLIIATTTTTTIIIIIIICIWTLYAFMYMFYNSINSNSDKIRNIFNFNLFREKFNYICVCSHRIHSQTRRNNSKWQHRCNKNDIIFVFRFAKLTDIKQQQKKRQWHHNVELVIICDKREASTQRTWFMTQLIIIQLAEIISSEHSFSCAIWPVCALWMFVILMFTPNVNKEQF